MKNYKPMVFGLNGVVRDFVKDLNFKLEELGHVNYDYSEWWLSGESDPLCDSITEDDLFWKNLKPFDDAWYQINYFFNKGVPIYISTGSSNVNQAESWLDSWRIGYNEILPSDYDYYDLIKKLNPSVVIEDRHQKIHVLQAIQQNALMRRAWYNRDFWDVVPNIGNSFDLKADND